MLKNVVSLVGILFLTIFSGSTVPILSCPENSSPLDGPNIRVFDEYVYVCHFNLTGFAEELRSHFLTIIGEDIYEKDLHNLTAIIDTDESINNIIVSPSCQLLNRSLNHEYCMNAIFNGTSLNLEIRFNPNEGYPDPINLSIEPSDTDFFSLDLQNNLRFGMWLNASKLLPSAWVTVSPRSQPSAKVQNFFVDTELKTGYNHTSGNKFWLELIDVPIGNHYLQFEVSYEGNEGNFYISVSASEEGKLFLPTRFYLDGSEVAVDKKLIFRYSSYVVEFLKGFAPWIYGYREPEYYDLNYVSPKKFLLRVDKSSRELIEYLLLDAEIERVSVEETYIYGNPTFQIVLELSSNSNVVLGLALYEKKWFLRPRGMELVDFPTRILKEYTDPSSCFDIDRNYIDKNNSLVSMWAEQIVGNETNPYFIADLLYQNLTKSLKYDDSLSDFNHETEFASVTLASRRGVCRHFARAYAALCMSIGLPVKTVLGTTFGNLNETSKKDHEWNEVYFPWYGWVAVDVTWKRFCLLSNAHSIYTHWLDYSDTLRVESMNQSRRMSLKQGTRKVLHAIISISKERLENITRNPKSVSSYNFEVDKAEELLAHAMTLAEFGDVHQSLLLMSEANLIINHIEEIIRPTHTWVYDLSFWVILASGIIGGIVRGFDNIFL